jgi:hypothetical protein
LFRAERSLRSLNALLLVLAFGLIILTFTSPIHDFLLPNMSSTDQSADFADKGLIALLICFFLGSGVACVWICSHERNVDDS